MGVDIYGIRNCDTMKKAFRWLEANGVDYVFHDYKKEGVTHDALARWCDVAGWEIVLNRRGTTFRKLPEPAKANLDRDKAVALMVEQPSMIKRPVLEADQVIEVGFAPERYAEILKADR